MGVTRYRVTPKNWGDVLRGIPNDGKDYEVIFNNGEYPNEEINLDHSLGGIIVLRAHHSKQAILGEVFTVRG